MIKNILFLFVAVISALGVYTSFRTGYVIPIFNIEIPSFQTVIDNKSTLDNDLSRLNTLNSSEVPTSVNKVEDAIKEYETKKQEYEVLALSASREDIAEANKKVRYLLDYLWIKVGNYAADNNVRFKMTPDEVEESLTFDITGSYIAITNFIYDLENDRELDFEINEVRIEGASSAEAKAYFKVYGIAVSNSLQEAQDA